MPTPVKEDYEGGMGCVHRARALQLLSGVFSAILSYDLGIHLPRFGTSNYLHSNPLLGTSYLMEWSMFEDSNLLKSFGASVEIGPWTSTTNDG